MDFTCQAIDGISTCSVSTQHPILLFFCAALVASLLSVFFVGLAKFIFDAIRHLPGRWVFEVLLLKRALRRNPGWYKLPSWWAKLVRWFFHTLLFVPVDLALSGTSSIRCGDLTWEPGHWPWQDGQRSESEDL